MEKWRQSHVKYCNQCKRNLYPNSTYQEIGMNCPTCNAPLEDTNMSYEEFSNIPQPSREQLFMEAMRKLKDTDPVKYEIAMEKYKQKMTAEQKDKEMLHCPKCNSTQLSANKKGFSLGGAALGGILLGDLGLLGGFVGSDKVEITCMKCGHKWFAGQIK